MPDVQLLNSLLLYMDCFVPLYFFNSINFFIQLLPHDAITFWLVPCGSFNLYFTGSGWFRSFAFFIHLIYFAPTGFYLHFFHFLFLWVCWGCRTRDCCLLSIGFLSLMLTVLMGTDACSWLDPWYLGSSSISIVEEGKEPVLLPGRSRGRYFLLRIFPPDFRIIFRWFFRFFARPICPRVQHFRLVCSC